MRICRREWTASAIFFLFLSGPHGCLGFFSSALSSAARVASTNSFDYNSDKEVAQVLASIGDMTTSPSPSSVSFNSVTTNRAIEITQVVGGDFLKPVVASLFSEGIPEDWNSFWSQRWNGGELNHAQRLAACCESLGPTYVKFAQAVSSRPDIVPKALADALSVLQDDMQPFDSDTAKEIIRRDLLSKSGSSTFFQANPAQLDDFLQSLSEEPVAAASVGQVFSGFLPGYGKVAVKVKRPGIKEIVDRDTQLLRSVAVFLESIPAIPIPSTTAKDDNLHQPDRLIATELKSSVDEFMSRLYEELDYRNEALNMDKFASLYSVRRGTSKNVKVVVPEVLLDLCTDNVIIMEFIEGTKLTNVVNEDGHIGDDTADQLIVAENLALVQLCIDCTLSQLLETGVLHADPHGGNLLKVARSKTSDSDKSVEAQSKQGRFQKIRGRIQAAVFRNQQKNEEEVRLAYLDFGMLSTVDEQVRDALICAVVNLVFARDVESVARLFGELQLLPDDVVNSPSEMAALEQSLENLFDQVLIYPEGGQSSDDTQIPSLRFDKLLDSLSRLIPRFRFDLPPYFLNNARALSTLEGIARSLDPTFSVLQVVYPYALNRLLRNPSNSPVVDETLQGLIRSQETGRVDNAKVAKLLDDAALITGYKRRKVLFDILRTRGGLRLTRTIAQEGLLACLFPRLMNRRRRF
ncbi:OF BC1 COMPLEX KINASE 3, chloroplastic [Seminavis robusta]|uniref:OF BC1 COMPLEX KINASE 3, chloroplastic n=1 Tax=Seminavis robusta TaxID=568900 RepID=A0A9N8EE75_9STRA|nr:OF BC1 COMPLEX KINASE 3, chloroplastic [Seminavis robusta]|eukprot:Sro865_g212820.1 OF BC1 COMPLEX KINASE 3, chloroplastic (691) ;mRNA; r:17814-20126